MISLHLPSCLDSNAGLSNRIGQLVLRYGEIEWMLCRVAACVSGDLDTVTKAMYRVRGETSRLEIAEAFIGNRIRDDSLLAIFKSTYTAIKECLRIRNRYAHAHWISGAEEVFGLYDIENIAKARSTLDFGMLKRTIVSEKTINRQEIMFIEVLSNLVNLFYRLSKLTDKSEDYKFVFPIRIQWHDEINDR